ncbi:MAG: nicotinate (nicotinamide) nucleotide adenylyltransferase [Gemmataceae bacterium]
MRIGLFGGSFDPVHVGHLAMAEQALHQAGLDEVWFLPAAAAPHKPEKARATFQARLDMLQLATAGHDRLKTCAIEKDLPAPNYTINTLRALTASHPGHQWYFILGGDMLADLPQWREPGQIVDMAGLVVMPRPGTAGTTSEDLRQKLGKPVRLLRLEGPALEVSSGWIRSTLASGGSVRYLVPRAVERYIQEHELYGAADPANPEKPLALTGVTSA